MRRCAAGRDRNRQSAGVHQHQNAYAFPGLRHPLAGRFLQRDPIGYAGGLNLYMYVGNQPISLVDPMGLNATKVGNWLRSVGAGGAGDWVDDSVDGASELADSVTGVRDAQDGAHAAAVQSMVMHQAEGVTSVGAS